MFERCETGVNVSHAPHLVAPIGRRRILVHFDHGEGIAPSTACCPAPLLASQRYSVGPDGRRYQGACRTTSKAAGSIASSRAPRLPEILRATGRWEPQKRAPPDVALNELRWRPFAASQRANETLEEVATEDPSTTQAEARCEVVRSGSSSEKRGAGGSRTHDGGFAIRCLSHLATAPESCA
jgi:hypothetical protein